MLRLKFKINKYYLLAHALKQYGSSLRGWKNFQDKLQKKYSKGFYLFTRSEVMFVGVTSLKELEQRYKEVEKIIKEALRSKEFQSLYRETKNYLQFIQKQWGKNEKQALNTIEDLSGLKLSDKTITVFLTHPKFRNGINVPPLDAIGWGHPEDWKNYSTVYIVHELMHILTANKYKDEKVMHALIELMTDNELRIRLNKKGRYFKEDKFDVGHSHLRKLEKKILPYWKDYLGDRKGRNIFNLEKEVMKRI